MLMLSCYRRLGCARGMIVCISLVSVGLSRDAQGSGGALLFLLGIIYMYVGLLAMSMHSLLMCDSSMGLCAHLLMLTCLPPITLVEGASLNKGYEIHVWRLYSALISRVMYSLGGISMLVQGASHLYWRVTLTPIGFLLTCQCALGVRG